MRGFQTWDTIQALSSYVRGVLTSQAILRGVGVGQEASTPLAAVFTFFVRDLAGMLGGILFSYLEGSSFDACAKQWRLFADITNDLGMTVELASPLFPRVMFLPIACLGSVARSLTGVAGGATRAALTQHFARRGNAADVSAKEQSQETATTILGMVTGMAVTRLLAAGEGPAGGPTGAAGFVIAWLVFLGLTAVHVVANVAAMRVLLLTSLNTPRLELLVDRYLQDGRVLSPRAVSQLEDLTPPPFKKIMDGITGATAAVRTRYAVCRTWVCVVPLVSGSNPSLERLISQQATRPYLLVAVTSPSPSPSSSSSSRRQPAARTRIHVHLVLRRSAASSTPDLLRAFVHCRCLAHFCELQLQRRAADMTMKTKTKTKKKDTKHQVVSVGERSSRLQERKRGEVQGKQRQQQQHQGEEGVESVDAAGAAAAAEAEAWMAARYDILVSELQDAGWHTDRVALPRPSWTAEWGPVTRGSIGDAGAVQAMVEQQQPPQGVQHLHLE
ncbi:hypothetical protein VOLCADRAFT_90737 [Volvox carteri f. nagariensis]|uniref:Protein root UVB sensitive/RUS domain-containing protein n=1 Tax=Volvox carteri f. nagariensis TaxID=3068 RepID=D8TVL3_VOLCA|nr:uncharacterized protein VOLCADRAFT_90737 [Volvox carteri f. nagariensis]EFJ48602.1 hypothetical protein VOLCADRAFT_90737 [Volvox carteri f. nagariensis]|eukprot:XP_002950401.1 hypothetical protein VOLCADRAFT_90737 [Volvox carteri f. nagariensis]